MTREQALRLFRSTRASWMRRARESHAAGNIAAAAWCIEGARIANRNLLHVLRASLA